MNGTENWDKKITLKKQSVARTEPGAVAERSGDSGPNSRERALVASSQDWLPITNRVSG
jgi:hypothetical protein